MSVGIILTSDTRSKAYLSKILENNIPLNEIIFMDNKNKENNYSQDIITKSKKHGFDISQPIENMLKTAKLNYKKFDFVDINHPELIEHLQECNINFFIFTGGGILKKQVLNTGPKFVHFHPGLVPQYRGSTCFYYSIINDDSCGVTAFIMSEGLDQGPIIYQRTFPKPNHRFIDEVYDAYIRSETLVDVLKNNLLEKKMWQSQNPKEGETYYIIHPVLKHIAILSCLK